MSKPRGYKHIAFGTPPRDSSWLEGLVISHLGKGLAVESESGDIVLCHTRRRLGEVTVGDRVWWEVVEGNQGRVMAVQSRNSVLNRPGHNDKTRAVAANLDRVLVVIAPEPETDWLLLDQFLVACEYLNLGAAIVVNKIDLGVDLTHLKSALADYETAGYHYFFISAKTKLGLSELQQALTNRTSMLAGQSGVGKSSLTHALLPNKQLRIQELSEKTGMGRHTTTTATLYHLPSGGDLIDSPGVAVFGLAEMNGQDVAAGFPEFRPWMTQCQFNDCRHLQDRNCAVRIAAQEGLLSPARYQRYLKLLNKLRVDS